MNRIVLCPEVRRRFVAAAMTRRISPTLLSTPLIRTNFACVISAMTRASVVLPLPGGPEKITDGRRSASMARRRSLPGARMCSWPTNSSSERGRMRVASGAALSATTSLVSSNRSCTAKNTARSSYRQSCLEICNSAFRGVIAHRQYSEGGETGLLLLQKSVEPRAGEHGARIRRTQSQSGSALQPGQHAARFSTARKSGMGVSYGKLRTVILSERRCNAA